MLDAKLLPRLFRALNAELRKMKVVGEVGICGGAVMCLVFDARKATKDVDAIFRPTREIRKATKAVAERFGLPESWLNDAAKGFFHSDPPRQDVLNLSNLRVWAPQTDYMLAMKCVAARFDTNDREDVLFLIRRLGLKEPEKVFSLIERYYPRRVVPAKTRFFVEEILHRHPKADVAEGYRRLDRLVGSFSDGLDARKHDRVRPPRPEGPPAHRGGQNL